MAKITYDPKENKKLCAGCSLCCEYVNILIKKPKTKRQLDLVIWYLLHGVTIRIDEEGDWTAYLSLKCKALNKNKLCNIYFTRPTICREHSQVECDKYDTECKDLVFTNEKQFLAHINSNKLLKTIYYGTKNKQKKH